MAALLALLALVGLGLLAVAGFEAALVILVTVVLLLGLFAFGGATRGRR